MTNSSQDRPNILFLFSDEHRWRSMGHTGMPELQTPHMDAMAREGLSLTHCIANNPVCVPYRAMLLSGLWSQRNTAVSNGVFFDRSMIGKRHPTLGHTISNAGYRTGYIGKWHLGGDTSPKAGFETFLEWHRHDDHWNSSWSDVMQNPEVETVYDGYNAVGMTDQALQFIDGVATDERPFFLMLSWNPPHFRWDDAPTGDAALYPNGRLSTPANAPDSLTHDLEYRHYHAHITAVDRELGRILEKLDTLGLRENTIVIYTSDHGSGWHSNGYFSKPHPTDEVVRVPGMIQGPGIEAGRTISAPIGTLDLHATLCGWAGTEPASGCPGQDISRAISGETGARLPDAQLISNPVNPSVYFRRIFHEEVPRTDHIPFRGIRTVEMTYVVTVTREEMLYHHGQDPDQLRNLAADPAYAEEKTALRQRLRRLMEESIEGADIVPPNVTDLSIEEWIAAEEAHYALKWSERLAWKERDKILAAHQSTNAAELITQISEQVYDQDYLRRYGYYRLQLYSFWAIKDDDAWKAKKRELDDYLNKKAERFETLLTQNDSAG